MLWKVRSLTYPVLRMANSMPLFAWEVRFLTLWMTKKRPGDQRVDPGCQAGSAIIVSVMSRLSLLVVELTLFPEEIEMPHFKQIRDTGSYDGAHGFTACHFYLPEEFRAAFDNKGVEVLELAGLEGISSNHRRKLNKLAKDEAR